MRFRITALLALLALGGCVTAGNVTGPAAFESRGGYTVGSGEKTALGTSFLTLDPKSCGSKTPPTATIVKPPRHGKVNTLLAKGSAQYPPGPMRHCHNKIGTALTFQYQSEPGFSGYDSFTARIRFDDGEIRYQKYKLRVL